MKISHIRRVEGYYKDLSAMRQLIRDYNEYSKTEMLWGLPKPDDICQWLNWREILPTLIPALEKAIEEKRKHLIDLGVDLEENPVDSDCGV